MNAVEHGEGKDVVVTTAIDSNAVAVSVRDYGVGLRPGEEQLVFDRFWRADPHQARAKAAPAWAWLSRWRTRTCTAAGCKPGASAARARCSG